MELINQYGNAVTCKNSVPQKKGQPPIACNGTNDWTIERSEVGYGLLIRCNHCEKLVRYFSAIAEGSVIKKHD